MPHPISKRVRFNEFPGSHDLFRTASIPTDSTATRLSECHMAAQDDHRMIPLSLKTLLNRPKPLPPREDGTTTTTRRVTQSRAQPYPPQRRNYRIATDSDSEPHFLTSRVTSLRKPYPTPSRPRIKISPFLNPTSTHLVPFDLLEHPGLSTTTKDILHSRFFKVDGVSGDPSQIFRIRMITHASPGYFCWTLHLPVHANSTIYELLEAMHNALRKNVTAEEYGSLSGEGQELVAEAYKMRCGRIQELRLRDAELRKGVKRIDFLGGKTQLRGICIGQIWEFYVA